MFDKQHNSSGVYLPGSNLLRKIRQEPSGFPAVGSIWNIAARATSSSRASDPIPGSGPSGWMTRPSNPATPRRGRPQRIRSYGWSTRHWRSSRNRQPTRVLWAAEFAGSSGYCVVGNRLGTLLHIAPERIPTSRVMSLGWQLGSFCVGRSTFHFGD